MSKHNQHKYPLFYDTQKKDVPTYVWEGSSCPKNGEEFFCHTTYGYLQKYRITRLWGNNGKVLGLIATPVGREFHKTELAKHFTKENLDRLFGEKCWSGFYERSYAE